MGTYAKVKGKRLQKLMAQPAFAVLSHWVFQSLFYMDAAERWFKLGLDAVLTILIGFMLSRFMPGIIPWVVAFAAAHSINFLFNGQLWGVLKHYGLVQTSKTDFEAYVLAFRERARAEKSIDQVLVYGSLAKGEWKESSDFDARIICKAGMMNAVHACAFLLFERTRALFRVFPIDVYVVEDIQSTRLVKLSEAAKDLLNKDWKLE